VTIGPALLEARDARQAVLDRALGGRGAPGAFGGSFLFLSANVPGPRKYRPGLARLLREAAGALQASLGLDLVLAGRDLLGPYQVARTRAQPAAAKAAAVALESRQPAGRLLDVDIYAADGRQLDRAALGLAPRTCFLCGEPARACASLRRHAGPELLARVDALLGPYRPVPADLERILVRCPRGRPG